MAQRAFTQSQTGSLTVALVYDPYGNPLSGGLESSLGFQEDYSDPEAGLVWMGARWYSPETCSFLSRDPASGPRTSPLSRTPYLYCGADPVNLTDPTGRLSFNPLDWAKSAVNAVYDVGKAVYNAGKAAYNAVRSAASWANRAASDAAKKIGSSVSNAAKSVGRTMSKLTSAYLSHCSTVLMVTKEILSNPGKYLGVAASSFQGFSVGFTQGVGNFVTSTVKGIGDLATGKIGVSQFLSGMKDSLVSTGKAIGNINLAVTDPYAYGRSIGQITGSIEAGLAFSAACSYVVKNFISPAISRAAAWVKAKVASSPTLSAIAERLAGEGGFIRNPFGSKGGPLHQGKIMERIDELVDQDYIHKAGGSLKEEVITIDDGFKSSRRPDITMLDPEGNIYYENVGRATKSGLPVAREVRAIQNIEKTTGVPVQYTPYNR